MIKVVITNEKLFRLFKSVPLIRKLFVFNINYMDTIRNRDVYDLAISTISTSNNTMKTTFTGRFAELDDVTLYCIKQKENIIHDIGVSSGITSLDLIDSLDRNGRKYQIWVSDEHSTFYSQGEYFCKISDQHFNPVCYYFLGIFFDSTVSWIFAISKYFYNVFRHFPVNKNKPYKVIRSFEKRLVKLIQEAKVNHIDYNVFSTSIINKFTYVRCMNVLNKVYFSNEMIIQAIDNIYTSLQDIGILQIGKTLENGVNNVSFYSKVDNKLVLIKDYNEGCEIKDLIERFNNKIFLSRAANGQDHL